MVRPEVVTGRPARMAVWSVDFKTKALKSSPEFNQLFGELLRLRQQKEAVELQESQLKQRIQQRMGEASQAIFEGGDVTWKRSKDSFVLDTACLLKEQPHLLQQYALAKPGSRRFLVNG